MTEVKKLSPMTVEEFEAMEKEERFNYELIDGIVMMSPSPSREHQKIGTKILLTIGHQLETGPCEPIYELDVKHKNCIYKPDLMVFCNDNDELPEIVFEILSPSTRYNDLKIKLPKYEEMGVKEYWIVDPKTKTITIYNFIQGISDVYVMGEIAQSNIHPEIIIVLANIFV